MESLSETTWDVIICGTGLQQSLLALALSRSDKKILHIDPNGYYGGAEAAFSLQEADAWAEEVARQPPGAPSLFTSAVVTRPQHQQQQQDGPALSFPRAYALALAPQLIHARSKLLSQLVSSRAFRQLEFLAVGSFFIYKKPSSSSEQDQETSATLTRIPSTREDVFSSAALPARAKRQLMKFLKLVLAYQDDDGGDDDAPQPWHDYADRPLAAFLADDKMGFADDELRTYIATLTLSLDGPDVVTTRDGLRAIHRHLTSMGVFGPGFAALYPKWGGGSEIAQVACRAGAVGGGIYMLGTGIKEELPGNVEKEDSTGGGDEEELVRLVLTDDTVVRTKLLVRASEEVPSDGDGSGDGDAVITVSRMIAILGSPLPQLFEATVEGSPVPAVAVVAFPPGSVSTTGDDDDVVASTHPIFAIVHSSDTGECPAGQSTVYLHTISSKASKPLLESALASLQGALADTATGATAGAGAPPCLYQLHYEQKSTRTSSTSTTPQNTTSKNNNTTATAPSQNPPQQPPQNPPQQPPQQPPPQQPPQQQQQQQNPPKYFTFPPPSVALTFDDATLEPVRRAWARVTGYAYPAEDDDDAQFMVFADREGVGDDDDGDDLE